MYTKGFDERIDQISWKPGPVPTRQMVDSVLGSRMPYQPRSALLTFLGAVMGILIGVGLKGMVFSGVPWAAGAGWTGQAAGGLILSGLAVSVLLALCAAVRGNRSPNLMQFSSINLLMIAVLLLS